LLKTTVNINSFSNGRQISDVVRKELEMVVNIKNIMKVAGFGIGSSD
jgi:hypothetical protein